MMKVVGCLGFNVAEFDDLKFYSESEKLNYNREHARSDLMTTN